MPIRTLRSRRQFIGLLASGIEMRARLMVVTKEAVHALLEHKNYIIPVGFTDYNSKRKRIPLGLEIRLLKLLPHEPTTRFKTDVQFWQHLEVRACFTNNR